MRSTHRVRFTLEEDILLYNTALAFGMKQWTVVARFFKDRTAKQLRDRFQNYLNPGIFLRRWTADEDELLFHKYVQHGRKWNEIAKFFPGRTANNIKNRFVTFTQRNYRDKIIECGGEIYSSDSSDSVSSPQSWVINELPPLVPREQPKILRKELLPSIEVSFIEPLHSSFLSHPIEALRN